MKGGLDLLNGAGDEIVDSLHRLYRELGRRQTVHKDLESHGEKGPTDSVWASAVGVGPRVGPARARPIRDDGEPRWEESHVGGISSVHHNVHGGDVNGRVHHKRPSRVDASLLQNQHTALVRVHCLWGGKRAKKN